MGASSRHTIGQFRERSPDEIGSPDNEHRRGTRTRRIAGLRVDGRGPVSPIAA
jgi:hypothetical protein